MQEPDSVYKKKQLIAADSLIQQSETLSRHAIITRYEPLAQRSVCFPVSDYYKFHRLLNMEPQPNNSYEQGKGRLSNKLSFPTDQVGFATTVETSLYGVYTEYGVRSASRKLIEIVVAISVRGYFETGR